MEYVFFPSPLFTWFCWICDEVCAKHIIDVDVVCIEFQITLGIDWPHEN